MQLVRINDVAATFAMGVNDPAPAVSGNGAAITPQRQSYRLAISDQYFFRFCRRRDYLRDGD
jgi:hypothetical protein